MMLVSRPDSAHICQVLMFTTPELRHCRRISPGQSEIYRCTSTTERSLLSVTVRSLTGSNSAIAQTQDLPQDGDERR
jgi:hypothetical protein